MSFAVGTIVKARGRQWVVQPESTDSWIMVQPLGGHAIEKTGIFTDLEKVEVDNLALPDPADLGDNKSCRLLRDAARLGLRSSAGPFRCFGNIAVEPRPYQLVPLLMALRQEVIRLLIADDVGIGKTIEAGLIAKEFLSRGEISKLVVLCPPHLVPQWKTELFEKFHIESEMVLASTIKKLERECGSGESIFDRYSNLIISLDFIKSDRHREDFLQKCPDFVIVDEAHTCSWGFKGKKGRHQRFELIKKLSADPDRHMLLVTATPHSGNEDAFKSLLAFLNHDFSELPSDLTGKQNEPLRRKLSEHLIQRNRMDIKEYELDGETHFPDCKEREETFKLSTSYSDLFDKVLRYTREMIKDVEQGSYRQRVRWWSALALLRSLASSPAAAAETMRKRAEMLECETVEELDEHGERAVMDLDEDDSVQPIDYAPGADVDSSDEPSNSNKAKLRAMAREADALRGADDAKLIKVTRLIKDLLKDGFQPIIFCRFIPTAHYIAEHLSSTLKKVTVDCVTGLLSPAEREERIEQLGKANNRLLVCTDCLSEGINLQSHFDSVVHYDLSWNPTRHAQRIGRVDRFGQKKSEVRVVTYYGIDNKIDGIVLDVLLKKHDSIRSSLGISVPVPTNSNQVVEAIFEGLLLRQGSSDAEQLTFLDEILAPQKEAVMEEWHSIEERTKKNRTVFAQRLIKPDEIFPEIRAMQQAVGSGMEMQVFLDNALNELGATISGNGELKINIERCPVVLKDRIASSAGFEDTFSIYFNPTENHRGFYISRTHPLVESIANYVIDTALDSAIAKPVARRCGVIRTADVTMRTTLLLIRFRFHIITQHSDKTTALLAEDCRLVGFEGSPANAKWIDEESAQNLLSAKPIDNIHTEQQKLTIARIIEGYEHIKPYLEDSATTIGQELLKAHRRVRKAADQKGITYRVEPKLPVDVLGVYVYLP